MIRIGIVGDIGSGKTFVANNFGYPVFNADHEVSKLYKKNKNIFIKLNKKLPKYIFTFPIDKAELTNAILSNKKNLGNSYLEKDFLEVAKNIQINAKSKNCRIVLPIDVVCAKRLENNIEIKKYDIDNIPNDEMVLDIGEKTIKLISNEIFKCRTVLWNGPLGAFEFKPFDRSSIEIANLLKKSAIDHNTNTFAGGGDTLSVINLAKAKDGFSYLSNAGGAFLEWLEGNESPGFLALEKNNF